MQETQEKMRAMQNEYRSQVDNLDVSLSTQSATLIRRENEIKMLREQVIILLLTFNCGYTELVREGKSGVHDSYSKVRRSNFPLKKPTNLLVWPCYLYYCIATLSLPRYLIWRAGWSERLLLKSRSCLR